MQFIFFIIINIINVNIYSSYLIFPFKTRFSQIPNTDKNISSLFLSLMDNHIFIELNIGTPPQIIEVFLHSSVCDFYISEKNKSDERTIGPQPYIYDVGSDLNKFFDKNNSISLEISKEGINSIPSGKLIGNVSYDIIHFISNKNENIDKKMKFILYKSTLGHMPGVIGLRVIFENKEKKYNFIDQLKLYDIIDSYFWMINYTSDYEGNLIIGEQPHNFDSVNFHKDELSFSYPFLNDDFYDWGLLFDEISFNDVNFRQFHYSSFNYELNYIKGNIDLENQLDIYFNESILNKTCFKEKIYHSYRPHSFFHCKKILFKDNMKYFPTLKFFQYDFNYTFELTYKDLFIEKNDKIILLIFFDQMRFDWRLGKPFLRKYSFLFNQDTKMVGFYKNQNIGNNTNKNNLDSKWKIILIVFVIFFAIVILVFSGILIGIYLFRKKRKNKYTIDEDYDYTTKNDEEIN